MTPIKALVLGLIQGLTEFLPVSSSGHLVIFQEIFGFTKPTVSFDILVHLGTLISILIIFKKDIQNLDSQMIKSIFWGLIPTAIIGLFLTSYREQLFGNFKLVGITLLITSAFLISSRFIKFENQNKKSNIPFKTALLIGIAQGIAVIPGISRSGITIVSGLWLGLEKKTALVYSFLLSIPAIIGAQAIDLLLKTPANQVTTSEYFIGFLSALISGWLSLKLLKRFVSDFKLHLFSIYTLIVSLLILLS